MYGRENTPLRNFIEKGNANERKTNGVHIIRSVFTSGLQSIKPVEDFESRIGFVEFIDNSKDYATVKVLNR